MNEYEIENILKHSTSVLKLMEENSILVNKALRKVIEYLDKIDKVK